jgi:adenosylcobinamide-phosphate synthase
MVDGVTAPVLYAYLGGPVAAAVYKAASTLDSTFGYRNERYIRFGWASARLDDVLNYVPARLTAPALCLATAVLGGSPRRVLQVSLRDGRKHASPNSGFAEAGMAGALGVQLGGPLVRDGRQTDLPTLGDPERPLVRGDILLATRLLVVTTAIWAGALDGMAKISERWSRKRTTGSLRLPPPPLRRL